MPISQSLTPVSGSLTPVTPSGSITPGSAPESHAAHGQLSTQEVISILDIPVQLTGKSTKDAGLRLYYAKYQACLKALDTMQKKFKDGTWPGVKMLSRTSIVEIFVSKTMWHSHVHKYFKNIADYAEMQMWLEEGDNAPDDMELWGMEKTSYTFNDLAEYLESQDRMKAKKGKGKEKKGEKDGKSVKKSDKKGEKRKEKM